MVRTPGQLLSLTSHLSFKSGMSPCPDRGQSPVFNTPEIMRDHEAYKENSFILDLNLDFSIGVSPPRNSDSFTSLKRKHDVDSEEPESQAQFKIPRTGLTEIFHFANLTEDCDLRYKRLQSITFAFHLFTKDFCLVTLNKQVQFVGDYQVKKLQSTQLEN